MDQNHLLGLSAQNGLFRSDRVGLSPAALLSQFWPFQLSPAQSSNLLVQHPQGFSWGEQSPGHGCHKGQRAPRSG